MLGLELPDAPKRNLRQMGPGTYFGVHAVRQAIEDAGWELGAIYHSHTRSPPVPSQTDINLAFYPDALYVIVGVAGSAPEVRAFRIVDSASITGRIPVAPCSYPSFAISSSFEDGSRISVL